MSRTFYKYIVCLIVLLQGMVCSAQSIDEYQMKAGYIGKFANYIDWSGHSEDYNSEFFIISIIGNSPIEQALRDFYMNQKINDKPVKILSINDITLISKINILFIAPDNEQNLDQIIRKTEFKPILTVSDASGFSQYGVLINFYIDNNTIRFEINKTMVEKADLEMNSLLYRVAKITGNE